MFKLTLRELFLVVTLAAVLVAWRLEHAREVASRSEIETRLEATEKELTDNKAQATGRVTQLANLLVDAHRACGAHGLYVQGRGANARLVENNGEDFKRSNQAEPYVLVDGNP